MADYKVISADSHISAPPDLWSTRVDKKYRERAPQLMVNPPGKEGAYFHYEGYAPHPIGIGFGISLNIPYSMDFNVGATFGFDSTGLLDGNAWGGFFIQNASLDLSGSLGLGLTLGIPGLASVSLTDSLDMDVSLNLIDSNGNSTVHGSQILAGNFDLQLRGMITDFLELDASWPFGGVSAKIPLTTILSF